jgi:predicted nucleic acid-binding protein
MQDRILIDTGPIVALFHNRDNYHKKVLDFFSKNKFSFISTLAVFTEASYFLSNNINALQAFYEWVSQKGIIISDDFSMEAAAREFGSSEAVVKALIAGSDMVMVWPNTARIAHRAIINALEEERLPRERLLEAVERILTEKIRFNLINLDEESDDGESEN